MKRRTSRPTEATTGTHAAKTREGQAPSRWSGGLDEIEPDCAFVDVALGEHWVSVPEDRDERPARRFGACTSDLREIARWLKACGIRLVGMESTGVYWINLYQILEDEGFDVAVVNARHVKNVKGRPKTDRLDCQWGRRLLRCGLLKGSFRPGSKICAARAVWRMRERRVEDASKATQRMHKALCEMNVLLSTVVSDIAGETGMRIIEAILEGERDPAALARLRDRRIRAGEQAMARALDGDFRPEQVYLLGQALKEYRFHLESLESYDERIASLLDELPERGEVGESEREANQKEARRHRKRSIGAPRFDAASLLAGKCGTDLTAIPGIAGANAVGLVCETGADMSLWRDQKSFVSWLSLCPSLQRSAGRVSSSASAKSASRAAARFRQAASAVVRSECHLGRFYRRLKARSCPAVALTATARKIAVIYYWMLKNGAPYAEPDARALDEQSRLRRLKALRRQAASLGVELVEKGQAA